MKNELAIAFLLGTFFGFVFTYFLYDSSCNLWLTTSNSSFLDFSSTAVLPQRENYSQADTSLSHVLARVAVDKELIVTLASKPFVGLLETYVKSLQKSGVHNYLIIALDDDIAEFCKAHQAPFYRRDPLISEAQRKSMAISAQISGFKFKIIQEILELGYSVLLSDADIAVLQNPFHHLYRDCDIETMSDGFDNVTAYGDTGWFDDPTMGWSSKALNNYLFGMNSGFFYVRPSTGALELMRRMVNTLLVEPEWDQKIYNRLLTYPSHLGYRGLHASLRIMDYMNFMNSKVLFKVARKDAAFVDFMPVVVHINYHRPEQKLDRLKAVIRYYIDGDKNALAMFEDGS